MLSTQAKNADTTTATLRDLSMKCSVTHLWGGYFEVKTEKATRYRVEAVYVGGDFEARCQCPVRTFRRQQCRHELAVIRFERSRVAARQFGEVR